MVFDRPFRLVALITPLLVRVQQHVERLILTFESVPKALTTPVSAIRSISKGPSKGGISWPSPCSKKLTDMPASVVRACIRNPSQQP